MRRFRRRSMAGLLAAALFPLAAAAQTDLAALAERAKIHHKGAARKVLAFYYPWYGTPDGPGGEGKWVHWKGVEPEAKRIASSTHYPTLGAYDSHDREVVAQHCRWAKTAALDGFIVSWWGRNSHSDRAMGAILDLCQEAKLQVTIYHERIPGAKDARSAANDLLDVLRRYAKHPAWLRVNDKPVVFVYGRAVNEIGLLAWADACAQVHRKHPGGAVIVGDKLSAASARVFDGIHTYNTAGKMRNMPPERIAPWAGRQYADWVALADRFDRISTLTLIPGYDDTKIRTPGLNVKRFDGASYRAQWEQAIQADPHWVLITSFNEWHEGSEIEPSAEYGDEYLKWTGQYARRFKSQGPRKPARKTANGVGLSAADKQAALRRFARLQPGILPGADLGTIWPLLELPGRPKQLSWKQAAGLSQDDAKRLPMLLYAAGETYQRTAEEIGDVDRGLLEYLRGGGCLAFIPSGPMPMHYDSKNKVVSAAAKLGLPLSVGGKDGGWQSPPKGVKLQFICDTKALPHLPKRIAFPQTGDLRWRPLVRSRLDPGDLVVPLIELRDAKGKSYGLAAAYVEHRVSEPKNAKLLYVWFGLTRTKHGEVLLYDVYGYLGKTLTHGID